MATYPTIPSLPPLEVDVKVSLNGDHITPVSFGPSITYEFPEPYTTDKISEIVVGELPMNFMRLRGMFGGNSVSISRSLDSDIPQINQFSDSTDSFSSEVNTSSPSLKNDIFNALEYKAGSAHVWDQPGDPLYFPTIDFFPRFNQWFAAATWPYPYDEKSAIVPSHYTIYLIYVDRVSKKTYWREARANLVVGEISGNLPAIGPRFGPLRARLTLSIGNNITPFSYTLFATGSPTSYGASNLPPGLSLTGNVISGVVVHPNPGSPFTVGPANVTATNNVATTSAPLVFDVFDQSLEAPTIEQVSGNGPNITGLSGGSVVGTYSFSAAFNATAAPGSVITKIVADKGTVSAPGITATGSVNQEPIVAATVNWTARVGAFYDGFPTSVIGSSAKVTVTQSNGRTASFDLIARGRVSWLTSDGVAG